MHALCNPFLILSLGPLFLQTLANPIGNPLDLRDVPSPSEPNLLPRWSSLPYPDADTIKDKYFEDPPKDKSLFFTGLPLGSNNFDKLKDYASDNGLKFVNDQYANKGGDDFCDPAKGDNTKSKDYRQFSDDFCSIFAKGSSGTVFVGIPGTCSPDPDSTWVRIERPALESNDNVKKIIRFDPTKPDETTTIYPAPSSTAPQKSSKTAEPTAKTTANANLVEKRDTCPVGVPALPPKD